MTNPPIPLGTEASPITEASLITEALAKVIGVGDPHLHAQKTAVHAHFLIPRNKWPHFHIELNFNRNAC